MTRRELISVCIVALFGILLMAQNCPAQTGICDADPCQSIPNAIVGTCTEIGGSCSAVSDYICSCDSGYDCATLQAVEVCDPCEVGNQRSKS